TLYGIFAGSVEPAVLPLFAEPAKTEVYLKFEKELAQRQEKLSDFLKQKHAELIAGARKRVAEYLMAVHALRGKPNTGEFMLIADGNDLNPTMIVHWQNYLERTRKQHDPVFALWHAFASLPETSFGPEARELIARLSAQSDPAQPVNPLVLRAFVEKPPENMADAAQRYAE